MPIDGELRTCCHFVTEKRAFIPIRFFRKLGKVASVGKRFPLKNEQHQDSCVEWSDTSNQDLVDVGLLLYYTAVLV